MKRLLPLLLCLMPLPAAAATNWLIATPDESARAGAPIVLEVVRPTPGAVWPTILMLRLAQAGKTQRIELRPDVDAAPDALRRAYRGTLPKALSGLTRVDLADAASNRLALLIQADDTIETLRAEPPAPATPEPMPLDPMALEEPALSANEPMYFVLGGSDELTARFQLSFKYRMFDPDSVPVNWFPPLAGLHFGYTQTSLWDLGEDSAPFRDTSYRPSFFWQGRLPEAAWLPFMLRGGYEHESNGKDGDSSRSIDTLFLQPAWRTHFSNGSHLVFAPKLYAYLDKEDNADIPRHRGHVDWYLRYGYEDGWLLTTRLRRGTAEHYSAQLDLSYPLRKPLFARTGGFVHLQLFQGYGLNLLEYDTKQDLKGWLGFSIIR